jgi:hypothetical protein
VHAAKPQTKETYCGRPVNEEDWVTTSKEGQLHRLRSGGGAEAGGIAERSLI